MLQKYSAERNVQILMALLKAHNIRDIIVSPGATNVSLVASCQQDGFFRMYSCVDERSAAYIACGIAAETGNPVVLSCTGATAARNYYSGLTEAYYRKLPILAVTSSRPAGWIGNSIAQVTDRRFPPPDVVLLSAQVPIIHDADEEWAYTVKINEAILELTHRGGGPVHINLETSYSTDFSVSELPPAQPIFRYCSDDALPPIPDGKVGIFVGSHKPWSAELTASVDAFCRNYDAVVLCDQTSNYRGPYRVMSPLLCNQRRDDSGLRDFDLLIHIGEVCGAELNLKPKQVWRVSPDGAVTDPFRKLSAVFEMSESYFFRACSRGEEKSVDEPQYVKWERENRRLLDKMPELPFSNPWIASQTISKLPGNASLHLGIYNSLRSWNFFESPASIRVFCNTGGFGIDGNTSSLLGSALARPDALCIGVVGDLSFFYDMNVFGNRHIPQNMRLIIVNNGKGTEFRQHISRPAVFGDDADMFIAAAGHNGKQSPAVVRHFAEDLGFLYFSASGKTEYLEAIGQLLSPEPCGKPMVLEVFTNSRDEDEALWLLRSLDADQYIDYDALDNPGKKLARAVLGHSGTAYVKKLLEKASERSKAKEGKAEHRERRPEQL